MSHLHLLVVLAALFVHHHLALRPRPRAPPPSRKILLHQGRRRRPRRRKDKLVHLITETVPFKRRGREQTFLRHISKRILKQLTPVRAAPSGHDNVAYLDNKFFLTLPPTDCVKILLAFGTLTRKKRARELLFFDAELYFRLFCRIGEKPNEVHSAAFLPLLSAGAKVLCTAKLIEKSLASATTGNHQTQHLRHQRKMNHTRHTTGIREIPLLPRAARRSIFKKKGALFVAYHAAAHQKATSNGPHARSPTSRPVEASSSREQSSGLLQVDNNSDRDTVSCNAEPHERNSNSHVSIIQVELDEQNQRILSPERQLRLQVVKTLKQLCYQFSEDHVALQLLHQNRACPGGLTSSSSSTITETISLLAALFPNQGHHCRQLQPLLQTLAGFTQMQANRYCEDDYARLARGFAQLGYPSRDFFNNCLLNQYNFRKRIHELKHWNLVDIGESIAKLFYRDGGIGAGREGSALLSSGGSSTGTGFAPVDPLAASNAIFDGQNSLHNKNSPIPYNTSEYQFLVTPAEFQQSHSDLAERIGCELYQYVTARDRPLRGSYPARALRLLSDLQVGDERTVRGLVRLVPRKVQTYKTTLLCDLMISCANLGMKRETVYHRITGERFYRMCALVLCRKDSIVMAELPMKLLLRVVSSIAVKADYYEPELFQKVEQRALSPSCSASLDDMIQLCADFVHSGYYFNRRRFLQGLDRAIRRNKKRRTRETEDSDPPDIEPSWGDWKVRRLVRNSCLYRYGSRRSRGMTPTSSAASQDEYYTNSVFLSQSGSSTSMMSTFPLLAKIKGTMLQLLRSQRQCEAQPLRALLYHRQNKSTAPIFPEAENHLPHEDPQPLSCLSQNSLLLFPHLLASEEDYFLNTKSEEKAVAIGTSTIGDAAGAGDSRTIAFGSWREQQRKVNDLLLDQIGQTLMPVQNEAEVFSRSSDETSPTSTRKTSGNNANITSFDVGVDVREQPKKMSEETALKAFSSGQQDTTGRGSFGANPSSSPPDSTLCNNEEQEQEDESALAELRSSTASSPLAPPTVLSQINQLRARWPSTSAPTIFPTAFQFWKLLEACVDLRWAEPVTAGGRTSSSTTANNNFVEFYVRQNYGNLDLFDLLKILEAVGELGGGRRTMTKNVRARPLEQQNGIINEELLQGNSTMNPQVEVKTSAATMKVTSSSNLSDLKFLLATKLNEEAHLLHTVHLIPVLYYAKLIFSDDEIRPRRGNRNNCNTNSTTSSGSHQPSPVLDLQFFDLLYRRIATQLLGTDCMTSSSLLLSPQDVHKAQIVHAAVRAGKSLGIVTTFDDDESGEDLLCPPPHSNYVDIIEQSFPAQLSDAEEKFCLAMEKQFPDTVFSPHFGARNYQVVDRTFSTFNDTGTTTWSAGFENQLNLPHSSSCSSSATSSNSRSDGFKPSNRRSTTPTEEELPLYPFKITKLVPATGMDGGDSHAKNKAQQQTRTGTIFARNRHNQNYEIKNQSACRELLLYGHTSRGVFGVLRNRRPRGTVVLAGKPERIRVGAGRARPAGGKYLSGSSKEDTSYYNDEDHFAVPLLTGSAAFRERVLRMYGFEVEYSGVSRSRAAVLAEQDSSARTSSTSVQNSSVAGEDQDHLPQEKQPVVVPARPSGDTEVGSGGVGLTAGGGVM
ncbi:unnamed protein product [Amoebophrya sp. A120]|nr:unnamed protein product [Amoebophrya sp. A120]|eukprot:GSA120T00021201001.1